MLEFGCFCQTSYFPFRVLFSDDVMGSDSKDDVSSTKMYIFAMRCDFSVIIPSCLRCMVLAKYTATEFVGMRWSNWRECGKIKGCFLSLLAKFTLLKNSVKHAGSSIVAEKLLTTLVHTGRSSLYALLLCDVNTERDLCKSLRSFDFSPRFLSRGNMETGIECQ